MFLEFRLQKMMIAWNPCYEYRASDADRFIFFCGISGRDSHSAAWCFGVQPDCSATDTARAQELDGLRTRIVLLDCLLIIGIAGQWWFVGRWLDRLRERRKHTRRWIILVATITIFGIVVAAAAFGNPRTLDFGAIILSLIAFLAWLALLLMFAVAAARWALRLSRKARPEYD